MNLRNVDLNLLVILDALLMERNVSRAGERIGLSQSAMSAALARLREVFHDPLLVRVGRDLALTRNAEDLIVPLRESLGKVEQFCSVVLGSIQPPMPGPSRSVRPTMRGWFCSRRSSG